MSTVSTGNPSTGDKKVHGPQWDGHQVITQDDVIENVFLQATKRGKPRKAVIPYLLEYVRSITRNFLRVSSLSPAVLRTILSEVGCRQVGERVNNMIVDLLVQEKRFFDLHQLLQYHVLLDSKTFAMTLISLEEEYEAAYQLGLDMMYRLGAFPEMMRVLLKKNQVLKI